MAVRAGQISLRDALVRPEDGFLWRVEIPLGAGGPVVQAVVPDAIAEYDLPAADSFLSIPTETMPRPEVSPATRAKQLMRDVLYYALDPLGAIRTAAPVNVLSESLGAVQKLVEAVVLAHAGYKSKRGRVPAGLQLDAQLLATGAFASSFGIRLEARESSDLFGSSKVGRALEDVFGLIEAGADEQQLRTLLVEHGGRVAARYVLFLKALAASKTDLKLAWGRPGPDLEERTAVIDWERAQRTEEVLLQRIEELTDKVSLLARLEGVDIHAKTFSLVDLDTGDRYTGRVDDVLIDTANRAAARVPSNYRAELLQSQEINPVTGEVAERFRLTNLVEQAS